MSLLRIPSHQHGRFIDVLLGYSMLKSNACDIPKLGHRNFIKAGNCELEGEQGAEVRA
jgi:hypothetical protein